MFSTFVNLNVKFSCSNLATIMSVGVQAWLHRNGWLPASQPGYLSAPVGLVLTSNVSIWDSTTVATTVVATVDLDLARVDTGYRVDTSMLARARV